MSEASVEEPPDSAEPDVTPLLHPPDGVPDLSTSASEISAAAELLAGGHGPFAVDAERASGFRYSNRAYLIQIRRAGAGTVLIDPVSHGGDSLSVLAPVAEVLAEDEWILHAADQDLPCLAEVGMRPPALYDTELAGRLAGFDRVNLAAMAQRLLGLGLAKGHGAADWSKRPLPSAWLNYAALDVEVLIGLRKAIAAVLAEQDKTAWAAEEFDYLRTIVDQAPPSTRRDRWRRTSGIHRVRNQRALAAVRELWTVRDEIAQRRDIAPGRILPDSAIIDAATADPKTVDESGRSADIRRPQAASQRRHLVGRTASSTGKPWPCRGNRTAQRPAGARALGSTAAGGGGAARCGARRAAGVVGAGVGADREPGHARTGATAVLGLGGRRRHRDCG